MPRMDKIGRGNTTVTRDSKGELRVTLHSTDVVTVHPDGKITLNTGGWRTQTTKNRMNQAANELSLNYYVYQRRGDWFVQLNSRALPFANPLITFMPDGQISWGAIRTRKVGA